MVLIKNSVSNYLYFLIKVFKTDKKVQKKWPLFEILEFFHNKEWGYINLSS